MSGIGVISNARSRENRRDPKRMRQLAYLIGDRGEARETRTLDDLHRVAESYCKIGIDILAINGGDGTIHHTLTAFLRAYGDRPLPPIAILRGGTMNTVSNSLGIKGSPYELLHELIDRHHEREPLDLVPREVLRVGDAFGFIFGTGLICNFLEAYYATGRASPATAAELVAKAVASAAVGGSFIRELTRRFKARITVDGVPWEREDFMTVTAACVEQIGLGFRPYYRWQEPARFHLLGIHVDSPLGLIAELPRVRLGQPMSPEKVLDQVARDVLIEADEIGYTVDGDTYRVPGSLRISVGPRVELLRLGSRTIGWGPLSPRA